jgi:lactoylglutathione lyase
MEMSHTRLLVTKFKECFLFYRDMLDLPVLWGDEYGTYADFEAGGHKLALFRRASMAEAIGASIPLPRQEGQDVVCLVWAVADVDDAYERLIQKGAKPINSPHDRKDWGVRCFHLRDPEGNLIEINHDFGVEGE